MKTVEIDQTTLSGCIREAQSERVVILRSGKPVALVVGVEGLDQEQLELGQDQEFWQLIAQRRGQKTLNREQLEEELP